MERRCTVIKRMQGLRRRREASWGSWEFHTHLLAYLYINFFSLIPHTAFFEVPTSLSARIDALGARIDALDTRIDTLGANLNARIDALGTDLNARIDTLGGDLNARIEQVYQLLLPKER